MCSVFSEDNLEAADEWCVLIESNKLSMVVYGRNMVRIKLATSALAQWTLK